MPAIIDIVKSAVPVEAIVGDSITYSIVVRNSGDVKSTNTIIQDMLSSYLKYANKLLVDGNIFDGNITQGINLGNLLPDETHTIMFTTNIVDAPRNKKIPNFVTSSFEFVASDGSMVSTKGQSEIFFIQADNPQILISKETDKQVVEVGDSFVYTIKIHNTGNIDAEQFVLTDILPPQFSLESITIDEEDVAGDLVTGLDLGKIIVDQIIIVKLKVLVVGSFNSLKPYINIAEGVGQFRVLGNTLIKQFIASDPVGVVLVDPKLRIQKVSDVDQAIVGEIITYSLMLTNEGDIDIEKVIVKDLLAPGFDFMEGSVKLDGMTMENTSILAGVDIGPLLIGTRKNITFEAKILEKTADEMCNQATVVYCYRLTPESLLQYGTKLSNNNCILVQRGEISVEKVADKKEASLNDIITYTVVVRNIGDTLASNVVFTDELPKSLKLLSTSILLNGIQVIDSNLELGINIGAIPSGGQSIIQYQAQVIGGSCSGKVCNKAKTKFKYILPNGTTGVKESNVSEVCICLNISVFRQLAIDKYCPVPGHKPDIEEVNDVMVDAKIIDAYVVRTQQGKSNEGQQLSGYKLVVNGLLQISVEYTAELISQPIHAYHCEFPFGTFVILPPDYNMGDEVSLDVKIEDVDAENTDCRGIFANIIYMIVAKVH